MNSGLKAAVVTPDGDGGVRMSWRSGDRQVRVAIAAEGLEGGYLYWQEGTEYGGERRVTPELLARWLSWLDGE